MLKQFLSLKGTKKYAGLTRKIKVNLIPSLGFLRSWIDTHWRTELERNDLWGKYSRVVSSSKNNQFTASNDVELDGDKDFDRFGKTYSKNSWELIGNIFVDFLKRW